jgi:septal ring factor EnvC (AmiA/AmiB activator)
MNDTTLREVAEPPLSTHEQALPPVEKPVKKSVETPTAAAKKAAEKKRTLKKIERELEAEKKRRKSVSDKGEALKATLTQINGKIRALESELDAARVDEWSTKFTAEFVKSMKLSDTQMQQAFALIKNEFADKTEA